MDEKLFCRCGYAVSLRCHKDHLKSKIHLDRVRKITDPRQNRITCYHMIVNHNDRRDLCRVGTFLFRMGYYGKPRSEESKAHMGEELWFWNYGPRSDTYWGTSTAKKRTAKGLATKKQLLISQFLVK